MGLPPRAQGRGGEGLAMCALQLVMGNPWEDMHEGGWVKATPFPPQEASLLSVPADISKLLGDNKYKSNLIISRGERQVGSSIHSHFFIVPTRK